jgi:hypothetical protein
LLGDIKRTFRKKESWIGIDRELGKIDFPSSFFREENINEGKMA